MRCPVMLSSASGVTLICLSFRTIHGHRPMMPASLCTHVPSRRSPWSTSSFSRPRTTRSVHAVRKRFSRPLPDTGPRLVSTGPCSSTSSWMNSETLLSLCLKTSVATILSRSRGQTSSNGSRKSSSTLFQMRAQCLKRVPFLILGLPRAAAGLS